MGAGVPQNCGGWGESTDLLEEGQGKEKEEQGHNCQPRGIGVQTKIDKFASSWVEKSQECRDRNERSRREFSSP